MNKVKIWWKNVKLVNIKRRKFLNKVDVKRKKMVSGSGWMDSFNFVFDIATYFMLTIFAKFKFYARNFFFTSVFA